MQPRLFPPRCVFLSYTFFKQETEWILRSAQDDKYGGVILSGAMSLLNTN